MCAKLLNSQDFSFKHANQWIRENVSTITESMSEKDQHWTDLEINCLLKQSSGRRGYSDSGKT